MPRTQLCGDTPSSQVTLSSRRVRLTTRAHAVSNHATYGRPSSRDEAKYASTLSSIDHSTPDTSRIATTRFADHFSTVLANARTVAEPGADACLHPSATSRPPHARKRT
ncbi:hypothetical protein BE221DRAFT_81117 [Ostreococcus tauri]|uniref:Uncharacterized protein n=1 Tax=Ostreococcus tauri TaxID=70448 RepID=A0A1Y5I7Q5_OSTTA|nr:hypothetical protein BE221DRAFT_81117 [Ostreococcus tauri]